MVAKSSAENSKRVRETDTVKADYLSAVSQENQRFIDGCVRQMFEERADFFVYEIKEKLRRALTNISPEIEEQTAEWIGIESLSRLRAIVGGRFQNLKSKWLSVGFPLRDSKNEKVKPGKFNQKGWLDLSQWILAQGYESRLCNEGGEYLFELRKIKG